MKSIIKKTYVSFLLFCFISLISFAQTPQKIEPATGKTDKLEIKTEKDIKGINVLKVTEDKPVSKLKSLNCNHTKDCKDEKGKDCCKTKGSVKMNKDCCKTKTNKNEINNGNKIETNEIKNEIK